MKPFRKPFFGDPLFPFEINHKNIKKQDNELPDHLHDRYELVYVYQGKGTFFIDNTWYEKKVGIYLSFQVTQSTIPCLTTMILLSLQRCTLLLLSSPRNLWMILTPACYVMILPAKKVLQTGAAGPFEIYHRSSSGRYGKGNRRAQNWLS